ncbi:MAG: ethanolamine utilization protein EutH [Clostridiales bacterium]|nr:ethanolamine utilization protein EutH [Clostridiales bacterium]MDD7034717.1 ethanolamine utilization protein EutH [Bacillota bacterium]MDY2919655.1 ethanolamine utilization protein EutH [Lentihominibacter sp.]
MNVFIGIMLAFAGIGFTDKVLGGKLGLEPKFDAGLHTMGAMVIPIVSICTVGTEFIRRHTDQIMAMSDNLFFDPSMIIGAILAPDMGGYFISGEIAASPQLLVLSGVVLGTLLGQAITFQLPVFMSSIEKEDYPYMFRGFIVGIIMIPVGLLVAELLLRMEIGLFMRQFLPILLVCLLLALCLWKIPEATTRFFAGFAKLINWMFYLMFAVAVIGVFIPGLAYAGLDSVEEAVLIVFKSAVIIAGSLVMSELILKFLRKQINAFAARIGINETAAVSLLMTCATSLAVMPLYKHMDEKGKEIVAAFSLSGSFVIGGSLAFVSNVTDGFTVCIFVLTKLVCGVLSAFVIHLMWRRK